MAIEGGSGTFLLDATAGAKTLQQYGFARSGQGKTRTLSVYCPDGTDPPGTGILAANTATIFVGPAGRPFWPLAPGAWKDFDDVDPGDFAFDSGGNASQRVFFGFGGSYAEDRKPATPAAPAEKSSSKNPPVVEGSHDRAVYS